MISRKYIELFDFLKNAEAFFVFVRIWWDDAGIDTVIWWIDKLGCHQRLVVTGEVMHPEMPRIVVENELTREEMRLVLDDFAATGIDDVAPQLERHVTTHFDDYYGIKWDCSMEPTWIEIAGGIHRDPRVMVILDCVNQKCPEIFDADEPSGLCD